MQQAVQDPAATFLRFQAISKRFGGVAALDDVSFSIGRGECHGLMGENGAGKSTLGKILAGIHQPDEGTIIIDDRPLAFRSPRDAFKSGIGMVHQELAFCPDLTIAENLCLGNYPKRGRWMADRGAMEARARTLLLEIGVVLDVRMPMHALSTAQEQLVQIAAAVNTGARVLVFDEPTSSLSEKESQQLFGLIERLKQRGVTMIYVSHRIPEVMQLCDQISVLRDGRHVGTLQRNQTTEASLIQMMIGRTISEYFPSHLDAAPGEVRLQVRGLTSPGKFRNVSLDVRAGEIVGFAGLVGSGRSEVAEALFGLDPLARGSVALDGKPLPAGRCGVAVQRGMGFVPEDRKRKGLILKMSCLHNFSLVILDSLRRFGFLDHRNEARKATDLFSRLRIKTPGMETPAENLSGGNQQKIVIAKWLAAKPRMLIVDEPTRGVDVGAKAEIHGLLDQLAHGGNAVLLISSELPELLNLATRILVMRGGSIVGEVSREEATQENLIRLMAGP